MPITGSRSNSGGRKGNSRGVSDLPSQVGDPVPFAVFLKGSNKPLRFGERSPLFQTGIRMTPNKYLIMLVVLLAPHTLQADDKPPAVDYLKQIKPIFTRHCVG